MGKVPAFHTDSTDYEPEEKWRYHDNDACGYGQRIKRDGNAVSGPDGRALCDRCKTLAAEEALRARRGY